MDAASSLIISILLCTFVGFAWTTALGNPKSSLQNLLLAPATGIALFVVPALALSRLGFSVAGFAYALVFVEIAIAGVLFFRTKTRIPRRELLIFGTLLLVTLGITAEPFLSFGFGWLGYANPDVSNYGLAAQRLLEGGLGKAPSMSDLLYHRDLSSQLYFLDFVSRERAGAQLLLALFAACAHKVPLQMVMPLSIGAFFATVAATAANLVDKHRSWWLPLVGGSVMAASSLGAFGTYLGLLGQCLGIPLLVASVTVISSMRFGPAGGVEPFLRRSFLCSILVAGLAESYPELGVFLALGFFLFVVTALTRRQLRFRDVLLFIAATSAFAAIILNVYLATVLSVASERATAFQAPQHLFEQYLVPSGLANLWGFTPLFLSDAQPWISIAIVAGALFLLFASAEALRSAYSGSLTGATCCVMLCAALYAYYRSFDFPLFKIAMYIQPFLLICLCAGAARAEMFFTTMGKQRLGIGLGLALPAIAAAYGLHAERFYVAASRDAPGTVPVAISAIPNGSPRQFLAEAAAVARQTNAGQVVLDDTDLTVEGYVGSFAGSRSFVAPGAPYIDRIVDLANPEHFHQSREITHWIEQYNREYGKLHPKVYFPLLRKSPPVETSFLLDKTLATGSSATTSYWISSPRLTVLNRFGAARSASDLTVASYEQIRNHLILMNHDLAVTLPWERKRVALTQPPEPDRLDPTGSRVQGFGQYELFQVVHPSQRLRLVFTLSETERRDAPDSDAQHQVPPVNAIGNRRVDMDAVGSGSARLISPEITPRYIDGHAFVALDMGRSARQQYYGRPGLMALFGKKVPIDNSLLVGYARDISAISPEQFESLKTPSNLESPLGAVRDSHLFYSGMYEDGFINQHAWFRLRADHDHGRFLISGDVTEIKSTGTVGIDVFIDNRRVVRGSEPGGPFLISVPMQVEEGVHKISVQADRAFTRPDPDGRKVSFQLSHIGFYRSDDLAKSFDIYDARQPIELGRGWYPYETFAGQRFRWVSDNAEIRVGPSLHAKTMELNVESGPGVGYRPFGIVAVIGKRELLKMTVLNGPVDLHIPAHNQRETITLRVLGGGMHGGVDQRTLNFRVLNLAFRQARHDIPSPDSIDFGADWYGLENFAGEEFRWASRDAVLLVNRPQALRMLVETGPAVTGDVMKLAVQAPDGTRQTFDVRGRQWITLKAALAGEYHFDVSNGNRTVGADPRTLNFRVFRIESLPIYPARARRRISETNPGFSAA